jgi:hypothetical protein
MSSAKVAAAAVAVAISLSACGVKAKPEAGTPAARTDSQHEFFDQRVKHEKCLTQEHIRWHPTQWHGSYAPAGGFPAIQVMTRPSGPTIVFDKTPGAAQDVAMSGQAQGAEAIGSALLYPNQAGDKLLTKVETCTSKGVTG